MKNKAPYCPEGHQSITPYLIVQDAQAALNFYKKVFEAIELLRMETPNNKIAHAEMTIGNSKFMLADECPEMDAKSPLAYGGSPIGLYVYVENVDAVMTLALQTGAKQIREVRDQFYGDRSGTFEDPYGHKWTIATHIEDLTDEEIKNRAENLFSSK